MESLLQWCVFSVKLLLLCRLSTSANDPYRWVLSRGKPTIQSSTEGSHVASIATDGDYNYEDLPLNYSQTTLSNQPHLQIDLGKSVYIRLVRMFFPKLSDTFAGYTYISVKVGNNATIGFNQELFHGTASDQNTGVWVNKKGRYVTIQRTIDNTLLQFTEVAVDGTPIENIAYMKTTTTKSEKPGDESWNTVDMDAGSFCIIQSEETKHWLRIDLSDIYLLHEVLIAARSVGLGNRKRLNSFDLRIGNSLKKNGNENPLCVHGSLDVGDRRSYYCDIFGRYINIVREGEIQVAEVVVNPETTDNIASKVTTYSNVARVSLGPFAITDNLLYNCWVPQALEKDKRIWIILGADYNIAMIHVVNYPEYLDQLVEFKVTVGMSDQYTKSTPCVPGYQNMADVHFASFFCEPRITGNHVFIYQDRKDKQMGLCEVGVFEETKPKIIDIKTDQFTWAKEGSDLTLTCNAKGYPAPVVTWVKDNVVIESSSSTLQLQNVKFNQSGRYECWANNTHGVDAKPFYTSFTSDLRVCVSSSEIKYKADRSSNVSEEFFGGKWYKFYDPKRISELEFVNIAPKKHGSRCQIWLKGDHPKLQDGVVSRTLCVQSETDNCSTTVDVYVRRCATYYAYNIKRFTWPSNLKFCFKNFKDMHGGIQPVIASPTRQHALSGSVFHTETEIVKYYQCLMMCQLKSRCKSFNFSKKLKTCELNSATKKEFPRKYSYNADYDYYHMGGGVVMVAKQDL